ncbi:NUDIX domain-containing protein [Actinacidiphila oryziradicis]|jgi:ADP-ribose pyrophosphatase YjhB (NUDIX family)|uniref:NUDIX domain-containing protein n=1 Tax=Actinacidiphila oryziradicis TaxID=2571141 RepID=UPI0023F00480|nr:NUDIX domain-containing protein [Actinacidiphila oryziradicis]MCW2872885.1 ADP-ribose pyrophosphatase YjhB, family [Actinacidiphila oryziradicis]
MDLHAGVILFHGERLALHDSYALPGGLVPWGGDLAAAAVDAARTTLGCEVSVDSQPCLEVRGSAVTTVYFRATSRDAPGRGQLLTREQALHAPLAPWTASEAILRSWSGTPWWKGRLVVEDPYGRPPQRTRAGAVVIRDARMLLIEYRDRRETWYEIPGGGVERGETPEMAVLRELTEETGLSGRVGREIAQVNRSIRGSHPGHYFLVKAEGEIAPRETLDLDGDACPVWIPVGELPATPLWPKRLGWRIAHWYRHGWPDPPAVLCDSLRDLRLPCDW